MTYRQPAFSASSLLPSLPAGSVTDLFGQLQGRELAYVVDYRTGELARWTSDTQQQIRADMGEDESPTRCIIPPGHTLDGKTLSVYADSQSDFSTAAWIGGTGVTGDGVVDLVLPAGTAKRYWAISFEDPVTVAPEISEVWLGGYGQLSAEAWVDPSFDSTYEIPREVQSFSIRDEVLQTGPPRRRYSLQVRNLDPSGPDYALLDQVAREGATHPFFYWPPDSLDPGPVFVQLERATSRFQEYRAPSISMLYEVELNMLEAVA